MIRPFRVLRRLFRWLLRAFERLLWGAALVCLGWVLFAYGDARLFQWIETHRLDRWSAQAAGRATSPPVAEPETGAVVGKIEIPRLGVDSIVLEGTEAAALRRGVGHVSGTALPGAGGTIGLAGHRDSVFRPLEEVRRGDTVVLTTRRGRYRYHVIGTEVVQPTETEVLDTAPDAPSERLTLITCFPFRYVGPAPRRFIVHARRRAPLS